MNINEARKININSPYFRNMLEELNIRLQEALTLMDIKCLGFAKVTLNMDIRQERCNVNRNGRKRNVVMPSISYKVGIKLDMQDSSSGFAVSAGDHEIKRAEDGSYYLITLEEGDGQIGIDDIEWQE